MYLQQCQQFCVLHVRYAEVFPKQEEQWQFGALSIEEVDKLVGLLGRILCLSRTADRPGEVLP